MRKTKMIVCAAMVSLAACGHGMSPEQQAFLQELADRPVTCGTKADCDAKWNRAIEWVSKHSEMGMNSVGDNLIMTNMVSDGNRPANKYPEFTVVRYAKGNTQRMDLDSYCDHGFACNPTAIQLHADFVTFIMGTPPGVTEVSPGVFQKTK